MLTNTAYIKADKDTNINMNVNMHLIAIHMMLKDQDYTNMHQHPQQLIHAGDRKIKKRLCSCIVVVNPSIISLCT